MEELIAIIVQALWEIVAAILEGALDGAFSWVFELITEWLADVFMARARQGGVRFFAFIVGCLGGRISTLWRDHSLLHHGWLRRVGGAGS